MILTLEQLFNRCAEQSTYGCIFTVAGYSRNRVKVRCGKTTLILPSYESILYSDRMVVLDPIKVRGESSDISIFWPILGRETGETDDMIMERYEEEADVCGYNTKAFAAKMAVDHILHNEDKAVQPEVVNLRFHKNYKIKPGSTSVLVE